MMKTQQELSEQLEAQSRAAIKAWCDDPSVQLEYCHKTYMDWMALIVRNPVFSLNNYHYRIAKPKKWYRVAKMKFSNGEEYPEISCYCDASPVDKMSGFIEWLDERKYYD